ncbi:MAG: 2-amino-4-hydroxy-6-hydroxymethyldihydropteridine diphosphokinase [Terriglobales bacterium]
MDSTAHPRETDGVAEIAYLSLGANMGDRAANLRAAIEQLKAAGSLCAVSGFYETQPVELADQPWFLNCALAIETCRSPRDLLNFALAIEAGMGRLRLRDKGPRQIDIDLLLFGGRVIAEPKLNVPHPAMHRRRFVLAPLAEIAPNALHPLLNKTVAELLNTLEEGQIVRRV